MDDDRFILITTLIGEQARAKMLWNLLDGRAYTAGELALVAGVSPTSGSNHLTRLLKAGLLKVELQGRHRYYSFARDEVAYVVESLASLTSDNNPDKIQQNKTALSAIRYCRSCYDHLAGNVGVRITETLEAGRILVKYGADYTVSDKGWKWLAGLDIFKKEVINNRRSLARQCLDWSERRPHVAGQIGAMLLNKMLERKWFKRKQFSRELMITSKGSSEIYTLLRIEI